MEIKIEMSKRLLYLTAFIELAESITGKTKLQKMVYLLNEEEHVKTEHNFSLYTYGPYSFELTNDLEMLEQFKYLKVDKVLFPSNGEYVGKEYCYKITEEGKKFIKDNIDKLTKEEIEHMKKVLKNWNSRSLNEIIKYVYSKYVTKG
ncbi:MAG: hypothetical protein Q7S21_05695 [archaeon]|nr:hypothetical protein [archaeon]